MRQLPSVSGFYNRRLGGGKDSSQLDRLGAFEKPSQWEKRGQKGKGYLMIHGRGGVEAVKQMSWPQTGGVRECKWGASRAQLGWSLGKTRRTALFVGGKGVPHLGTEHPCEDCFGGKRNPHQDQPRNKGSSSC